MPNTESSDHEVDAVEKAFNQVKLLNALEMVLALIKGAKAREDDDQDHVVADAPVRKEQVKTPPVKALD